MLAADKLLLQSSLKQNAIQLKEKELNLHNTNFGSLGTQAAVLAGFAVTALIEFSPPPNIHETRYLEIAYYVCCMLSLVTNLYCVAGSTVLSVFATDLALRGPDGSVERAVEGMHEERRGVFISFAIGLASLLMGMIFGAWIMMSTEAAAISSVIVGVGGWCVYSFAKRTYRRFSFEEHGDIDDFVYAIVSRLPRLPRMNGTPGSRRPSSGSSLPEEKKEV